MYRVDCDGIVLYDDVTSWTDNSKTATEPKLDIGDNSAGTFSIALVKGNLGYDICKKHISTITVYKENNWFWEGRIVKENIDFQNRKKIECEGALSYLNDIILPPKIYKANTPGALLGAVISDYNSRVSSSFSKRRFVMGACTVAGDPDVTEYEAAYESAYEFIQKNLLDPFGGHLFVKRDSEGLVLHYYQKWVDTSAQTIDFGSNLIDFTRDYDFSNICTVCIPRGKQLDSTSEYDSSKKEQVEVKKKNEYVTVASVNNGSIYVESTVVGTFGRVERVVDFNDVEDPQVLLRLASKYMSSVQFQDMVMDVKAVDLHVLNPSIDSFDLLDKVRCVSLPHGLDTYFPITKISIPLDKPDNVEYTMGTTEGGLTASVSSSISQTKSQFSEISTRESVLVEAFRNAAEILSAKTTGYVNIVDQDNNDHSQALIISDSPDWKKASAYWKFDMKGLGFYRDGELEGIAITMDGNIVANFVTTGTMSADRIRTGIIKDVYNDNVINLDKGEVYLKASKTVVADDKGTKYSLATSKDIGSINGKITTISEKQSSFQVTIDGMSSDVRSLEASYGVCYSPSTEKYKVVECKGFKLKPGAVIVVMFYNETRVNIPHLNVNNTGSKPIVVNRSYLYYDSKENWGSGQTVHFVYDNYGQWVISDGATESHIRQLADSITLSVTGKLGGTAQIQLLADGKVDTAAIDMSAVRAAFRDDPSTITISAGRMQFESGTFVLKSGNCSIDAGGTIKATNVELNGRFVSESDGRALVIDNHTIHIFRGEIRAGYINAGQDVFFYPENRYVYCMQLQAMEMIRINTPFITVIDDPDVNELTMQGVTGFTNYVEDVWTEGDGSVGKRLNTVRFVNGLLVAW